MKILLFLNLGGPEILVILFIAIVPLILGLICLVDIIRSEFKGNSTKLIWVLIVLFAPVLGSLIYLLFGKGQKVLPSSK